jgi:DNA-3-methyladenine glycosylase II
VTDPDRPDPHDALRDDEYLGPLIDEHGELTVDPAEEFFARFVTSILRQQVSMASAAATRERLFDAVAVTPDGILAADEATLREAGLSRQKTRYVRNVAEAFEAGLSRASLAALDDDAARERLTDITGVGEWTANVQLIFSLGREDVFPVGDLGVRKGMARLFDLDVEDRAEMVARAERWRPYRTYATLYCWQVEEDIADTVAEVIGE